MENNVFEVLDKVDVSEKSEKKGRFTYLSWAWAVRELLRVSPNATWKVHEWGVEGSRQPYMQTQAGCFVKVSVTVNEITREQVHPVLDNRNQPIKTPDAFQVNTSIQRCLAKAIALHGLGLYIFAGEDLPDTSLEQSEIDQLVKLAEKTGDKDVVEKLRSQVLGGKINRANFNSVQNRLLELAKPKEEKESVDE
jgi:hypothetical protein|tara:strand:+ start:472 stop:1053 length:582 start_codon:yes stop_codon:yes gene_type:complete